MDTLYTFVQENLTQKYLRNDWEYRDAQRCAGEHLTRFRNTLAPEQLSHLDIFLSEQLTAHSAQLEAVFQAGFSMAMELNRQP